jgi:hypothetical protein
MKSEKKIWSTPLVLNLDGSEVALGVIPSTEGSHDGLTNTGSIPS